MLTGVDPEVGFEVGRLAVHLPAAGERAAVPLLVGLLPPRRRRPVAAAAASGLFETQRGPAVLGVRSAAAPLLFLLPPRSVAAAETPALSGAVFPQVQQNHRHHQQSPVFLLVLFIHHVPRSPRRTSGDAVRRDIKLRHRSCRSERYSVKNVQKKQANKENRSLVSVQVWGKRRLMIVTFRSQTDFYWRCWSN